MPSHPRFVKTGNVDIAFKIKAERYKPWGVDKKELLKQYNAIPVFESINSYVALNSVVNTTTTIHRFRRELPSVRLLRANCYILERKRHISF